MKILIDTNIVISLEDNGIVPQNFTKFYNLAISNGCKILFHPNAIPKDISRDKNIERRTIILSKVAKYEKLENYGTPDESFLSKIKNEKINDIIDNRQLYQLHLGYVDYFVTQDKGIHSKAKQFNISDKVANIDTIISILEDEYTFKIPSHPIILPQSIRNIKKHFDSDFFDSLREDYDPAIFNEWLNKCAIKDRQCYTLEVYNKLSALLIYNSEEVQDHQIEGIYEKVLKICTLKVATSAFGIKLGELFLNKMFQLCIEKKINFLYLTVYEKQTQLISLLVKFGFEQQKFKNSQGQEEIRMIKCLDKRKLKHNTNTVENHPFYFDNKEINKYVIPIRQNFYGSLFKDGNLRQLNLFDKSGEYINEIQGNTIVKAYISNARIKNLNPGDLLFFYSSETYKVIEPIGVLESIQIVDNFDELWELVKKKTVFSQQQLHGMLNNKGKLNVIIFRLTNYLDKKISWDRLKKLESSNNNFQTITKLKEEDYRTLKDEGYFDKRYIID
ncbi:hypothetical protein [Carboxylicivirga marina]|uniref:hypothetical protein n=1 Tax=Carboxylicivirga marina TaxID=2800988 RepID=UPI00259A55C4|nr:hypothetical protein [uncultured Carboxylicivirga sp.]